MKLPRRRTVSDRWPLIAATLLAALAGYALWEIFLHDNAEKSPSDEELKEVEAFEEYERHKGTGLS